MGLETIKNRKKTEKNKELYINVKSMYCIYKRILVKKKRRFVDFVEPGLCCERLDGL